MLDELDASCKELVVDISGNISEFSRNKENHKQPSAKLVDILTASPSEKNYRVVPVTQSCLAIG
jgi:hypothetical protein